MALKIPSFNEIASLFTKSNEGSYSLRSGLVPQYVGFTGLTQQNQDEQKLIDKGYGSNVTVYAIIKKIAQSGADIPKVLIDENDPETPIESGELYALLQNPAFTQGERLNQFDYFEYLITSLLASGNTYQHRIRVEGMGDITAAMEILPSGLVTPIAGNSYRLPVAGYQFEDKQAQLKFRAEDILQTKFVNPTTLGINSLEGLSPLQAALYSLTGSTDIQQAIAIMVKNQGIRGLISSDTNRPLKPEEAKALQGKFDKDNLGIENFAKLNLTSASINYTQMGMTADQLKVIESGVLTDRQLCNAFSVSSRLFNDPANSTFNNVKEANKSMYQNAVIPTLNKLLADINESWLNEWSLRDRKRYKLILDTSSVEALQADQKTEAEKDKIVMEGVNLILQMQTTSEAKQQLLEEEYGYSEETAALLVAPVGSTNPQLEVLKSLSPLLANNIIANFTPEQKEQLLS